MLGACAYWDDTLTRNFIGSPRRRQQRLTDGHTRRIALLKRTEGEETTLVLVSTRRIQAVKRVARDVQCLSPKETNPCLA